MAEQKSAEPKSQGQKSQQGQNSQIDRLIALASEPASMAKREKLTDAPEVAEELPVALRPAEEGKGSFWKSLSHLKGALPYVSKLLPLLDARFLPLLEMLGVGNQQNAAQSAALAKEMHENLAAMETSHREMRAALQTQVVNAKALEEQVAQLREAFEANLRHQQALMRDARSTATVTRWVSAGIGVLLVVAIVMLGTLLARH